MRYDINMYCVYKINMNPIQKKESSESRVAAWQLDHLELISENILFLAYIPLILILFLALMLSESSVTHYTSIRYKAEV